ncbi:hypothetical protein, partial [Stutzerimonas degradans]|uniref:hypothetical protein n=1 Tax=Stutzerimonas degradans TaxID=2968968 RepID=UPI00210D44AC
SSLSDLLGGCFYALLEIVILSCEGQCSFMNSPRPHNWAMPLLGHQASPADYSVTPAISSFRMRKR